MAFYKEKIQKQLKKALESFKNGQNRSIKTHIIQKQNKKKRTFKSHLPFRLQNHKLTTQCSSPVLNFYNIMNINKNALADEDCCESLIQSWFFNRSIRKIQVKEHYIVMFLSEPSYSLEPLEDSLNNLKLDIDPRISAIGSKLQKLGLNFQFTNLSKQTGISLTAETYQMLDQLGDIPFVCKIFNQKMIISKSLLQLKQYDVDQFIVESLKCKLPLLELTKNSQNYKDITNKQIDTYSNLISVLHGTIPFASFLENSLYHIKDIITSKSNIQYECQMEMSMPIPLVQLIKIDKIMVSKQGYEKIGERSLFSQDLKRYQFRLRDKQLRTLNNLIELPINYKPEMREFTAQYRQIILNEDEKRLCEDSKTSVSNSIA